MKARIAVATVSGKAYYLIVDRLKERNLPFLSVLPNEPIPTEIKVVITTEKEKPQVQHEKTLAYEEETDLETLINEAVHIAEGREHFQRIVVGVDPGEVLGLAVLADGRVIETANCFSLIETVEKIKSVIRGLGAANIPSIAVKIGDGVPTIKESLLRALDNELPPKVNLESVSEAGTNRFMTKTKHRRGLRDIVSAIRIAGRSGQAYARGKTE
jgi:hypothetical protein